MQTATRPSGLLSAAAAALAGMDPMLVSDIPSWHPALAPAVRDLAASTGDRVPVIYALLLPPGNGEGDRDTIADLIGLDPREGFPASEAEAEEHYEWARANGLADDADEHPSDDDYHPGHRNYDEEYNNDRY